MEQITTPYQFDTLRIGTQWRAGASKAVDDFNPFSGEKIGEFGGASLADIDEAFRDASLAQLRWRETTPSERAAIFQRAIQIMDQRHEEIVCWLIHESGSVRIKAELEWAAVRAITAEAATLPTRVMGRIIPGDIPGKEHRIYRNPVGVVSVISPWNWPFHLTSRVALPALALGNAVVVKPASETPIVGGLLLARIFDEAGLPPGLLSIVFGDNKEIGDAFVMHSASRLISFTGSTTVGKRIGELAVSGPSLKRATLELGGNNPLVVLSDADLERAVDAAVVGRFLHQGQLCVSSNRIIVEKPLYAEFTERFVERVRNLKYGDPNDPATVVGPVINKKQLDGLLRMIEEARADGARERVGGAPDRLVLPPHVFETLSKETRLGKSEIFGPIAPLIEVADEASALSEANDTEFGLSSAVFSKDLERAERFAGGIQAGMTHINDCTAVDLANMPFGGDKNSGLGRFGAEGLINDMTSEHWISVQKIPRSYPF